MIDKQEAVATTELSTLTSTTSSAEILMKLKLNEINNTLADIDTTLHNLLSKSRRGSNATLTPGGE